MAAPRKQMQLNFFDTACTGSHVAIGHWKYGIQSLKYTTSEILTNVQGIRRTTREEKTVSGTTPGSQKSPRKGKFHPFSLQMCIALTKSMVATEMPHIEEALKLGEWILPSWFRPWLQWPRIYVSESRDQLRIFVSLISYLSMEEYFWLVQLPICWPECGPLWITLLKVVLAGISSQVIAHQLQKHLATMP